MAKLHIHYIPEVCYEDDLDVTFRLREDPNLTDLHRFMKQYVAAMGFGEKEVDNCFGPTNWSNK